MLKQAFTNSEDINIYFFGGQCIINKEISLWIVPLISGVYRVFNGQNFEHLEAIKFVTYAVFQNFNVFITFGEK